MQNPRTQGADYTCAACYMTLFLRPRPSAETTSVLRSEYPLIDEYLLRFFLKVIYPHVIPVEMVVCIFVFATYMRL